MPEISIHQTIMALTRFPFFGKFQKGIKNAQTAGAVISIDYPTPATLSQKNTANAIRRHIEQGEHYRLVITYPDSQTPIILTLGREYDELGDFWELVSLYPHHDDFAEYALACS